MSVRLREAEAQAEMRESRQRMLELDTQVRPSHTKIEKQRLEEVVWLVTF